MKDNAGAKRSKPDWVTQTADRVLRRFERDQAAGSAASKVVIASGISPSGPIHLGNLREILVPHFVAEEIKGRGIACEHLLSWDDYDRLRKVPAGVDEHFGSHIGEPLSAIPDPHGDMVSWAERFKTPLRQAMVELGVELRQVSQHEMYGSGAYRSEILHALHERKTINEVLGRFRTLETTVGAEGGDGGSDDEPPIDSGAEVEDDRPIDDSYWPYKVYCQSCGGDFTEISGVDREGNEQEEPTACWISYSCSRCDHRGRFDLMVENHGKLVWKVDWPMRWAFEGVTFEAGGADHSSPGSSFSVGSELVREVFAGQAPEYEAYSFVGSRGVGKLSSSTGAVPTPLDALAALEAPILRWMYVRKTPRQGITIDLAAGIHGIYDEWDTLGRNVLSGKATPSQIGTLQRANRTSIVENFATPQTLVAFRTLTSAVSVAAGDQAQTARIIGELTELDAGRAGETEPRLSRAHAWVEDFAPPEERITVRSQLTPIG